MKVLNREKIARQRERERERDRKKEIEKERERESRPISPRVYSKPETNEGRSRLVCFDPVLRPEKKSVNSSIRKKFPLVSLLRRYFRRPRRKKPEKFSDVFGSASISLNLRVLLTGVWTNNSNCSI